MAAIGCIGAPPLGPTRREPAPLHVAPLTDLAPAAALTWLVELHPRAILGDRRLSKTLAPITSEERLQAFAQEWGGVDLREADALVFASYPGTLLSLAHQAIERRRVEAAFTSRVGAVAGRTHDPRSGITRLWGAVGTRQERVAILGGECVGLEQGRLGPLLAAELFAEGRLKRASPALHAPPLQGVAELLGDAPLRAFAPGPFESDLGRGAGGLLAASTAVGTSVRLVDAAEGEPPIVAIRVVLLGAWGSESQAAASRLKAVFEVLATSGMGRLLGLSQALGGPSVEGKPDVLALDVAVDASVLVAGLRAATSAEVSEIMGIF